MKHTAVTLPVELLTRIQADAERAERSVSAEIRRRLTTYDVDDPETKDLIENIKRLADNVGSYFGKKWHKSEYAKAVFAGGMLELLGPLNGAVRDIPGHNDTPEAVGRTLARLIMAARRRVPGAKV